MKQRKVVLPVFTAAILVTAAALSWGPAYTQDSRDLTPSLAQKIADRFGLNADEVKQVFDEAYNQS